MYGIYLSTVRIERFPPFGRVLKVLGEPCHDCVLPEAAFRIVGNEMILTLYGDQLYIAAEYAEGIIELDAFSWGDISIGCAMQQKQRSVDFIGIEERTLTCE